jgi:GntR family transcriptional regulator, frlABCD operon transcriptional regulator
MKLNNSSSRPLYEQLKNSIKDSVEKGDYRPSEKIPNEGELCERYGVSRITVRRAIKELVSEGLLERKQGKGTFVTRQKVARELVHVNGFTDFSKQLGKNPSKRVLALEELKASKEIAEALHIDTGTAVLKYARLMFMDEQPFVLDVSYYSLNRFPNLTQKIHEYESSYDVLKNVYHTNIDSSIPSKKILTVTPATIEDAEYLECEIGDTLFNIDKTLYDETGVPIHISNYKVPTSDIAFTIST